MVEYTGWTEELFYDRAGNRTRYEYDTFNRMTKVENFNGNVQINRYDPESMRHEMEENRELVRFIFRDREVIAEEKEKGRHPLHPRQGASCVGCGACPDVLPLRFGRSGKHHPCNGKRRGLKPLRL